MTKKSHFDWSAIPDSSIEEALDILVANQILIKQQLPFVTTRYKIRSRENFTKQRVSAISPIFMAMSGEGYSLLQEAIPNLLSHREVGNESNQTEAEKGDLIERLLKDNIISSQTALGLKAYFDAVIEGYLAQTKDANKLPDDWSFLERISELCGAIGNEEALRASEIDDANKAIGSLEAKIAELTEAVNQLEEKVAAGIEPSSPFGLLKQNLAASAGSAIIPVGSRFAALGLMYLTGIPADAIAATAAYLSSKSYK